jgi:hypothetical protein
MKQLWVCDYCGESGNKNVIRPHEEDCDYNPANKRCGSCKHKDYGGAPISGIEIICNNGLSAEQVIEDEESCAQWEANNATD